MLKNVILVLLLTVLSIIVALCLFASTGFFGRMDTQTDRLEVYRNFKILIILAVANIPVYLLSARLMFRSWKRFWGVAKYHFIYFFRILEIGYGNFLKEYFSLPDLVLYYFHSFSCGILIFVQWLVLRIIFLD